MNRCTFVTHCTDCKRWTTDMYQRILYEEYTPERKAIDTARLKKSAFFVDTTVYRPKRKKP